jgi:hypothetical protein
LTFESSCPFVFPAPASHIPPPPPLFSSSSALSPALQLPGLLTQFSFSFLDSRSRRGLYLFGCCLFLKHPASSTPSHHLDLSVPSPFVLRLPRHATGCLLYFLLKESTRKLTHGPLPRYTTTTTSYETSSPTPTSAASSIAYSPFSNGFQPTSYPQSATSSSFNYSLTSDSRPRIPAMYEFYFYYTTSPVLPRCVMLCCSGSSFPLLQTKPYVSNGAAQPIILGEHEVCLTIARIFCTLGVHDYHSWSRATFTIATATAGNFSFPSLSINSCYCSLSNHGQPRFP